MLFAKALAITATLAYGLFAYYSGKSGVVHGKSLNLLLIGLSYFAVGICALPQAIRDWPIATSLSLKQAIVSAAMAGLGIAAYTTALAVAGNRAYEVTIFVGAVPVVPLVL